MNKRSLLTNVEYLSHPEKLSRSEMLRILEMLYVNISPTLPIEKIIEIYNKVAVPLPPRNAVQKEQQSVKTNESIDELNVESIVLNEESKNEVRTMSNSKSKRIKLNRLCFSKNDDQTPELNCLRLNGSNDEYKNHDFLAVSNDGSCSLEVRSSQINNCLKSMHICENNKSNKNATGNSSEENGIIKSTPKPVTLKRTHLFKYNNEQMHKRIKL